MPDYDYGNARLKAMKSRLLGPRDLGELTKAGNVQALISMLAKTNYQKSIESALTRTAGVQSVEDALRSDLESTIGKIRYFYTGDAGQMIEIILRSYDIHNLKAILRGLSKRVPAKDIFGSLVPIGEISFDTLRELASLDNPREAIDVLASTGCTLARPLVDLRTEKPGAPVYDFELALEKWHYQQARRFLRSENRTHDALNNALALDADIINCLVVLRFAREPGEIEGLRARYGDEGICHLLVGPGHISFESLVKAANQTSISGAIEQMAGSNLYEALLAGFKDYEQTQRLTDIELHLKRFRLGWMVNQMIRDPLGIGVVLGYVALKTNEISNIRWVCLATDMGLNEEVIRNGLEIYA